MRTIKDALEDGSLSLEDEIDYPDMSEEEYKEEIKRLNTDKEQLTSLVNSCQEEIRKLKSQLQQKENIIKEVREWAKKYSCQFTNDDGELVVSEISFNIQARPCDLFKILDKAGDSNERNKDNK